jgi:hypothetical protein
VPLVTVMVAVRRRHCGVSSSLILMVKGMDCSSPSSGSTEIGVVSISSQSGTPVNPSRSLRAPEVRICRVRVWPGRRSGIDFGSHFSLPSTHSSLNVPPHTALDGLNAMNTIGALPTMANSCTSSSESQRASLMVTLMRMDVRPYTASAPVDAIGVTEPRVVTLVQVKPSLRYTAAASIWPTTGPPPPAALGAVAVMISSTSSRCT